jgi:hypothetical protein
LAEQSIDCSFELIAWVTSRYGAPTIAVLPQVRPDADHAAAFEQLLIDVRGASVVLFPDICPDSLDGFFHLRLAQVLRMQSPLSALSIIAISPGRDGSKLAGGFSDRFRSGWPFAHCLFVTSRGNPRLLTATLGLPVDHAFDPAAIPAILSPRVGSDQKIAMLLQPIWRRCGSTTGFENQIQSLVRAGFLTIRLFTDGKLRRGPTLNAALKQVIPENGTHAGAHINLVSVPSRPPNWIDPDGSDAAQVANWLAQESFCTVYDANAMQAAKRAHSVIATHLELLGPALLLAPQARLLLDVPDDRVLGERAWALAHGATEAQADIAAAAMVWAQQQVLAIADLCTFVSVTEAGRLGPQCQRSATVPPRIYAPPARPPMQPVFDLLLTGDLHVFNVASLRWFLDDVWLPYLAEASVNVAIAGRVGDRIGSETYTSPLLHFMGFVEDLEAVRSQCRLTVVPDRAGTGVSVKLLNALAVEHPVATTSTGLRGLESSVARLIPAHDEAAALAADILNLIGNTQYLEERRTLVREAQQAIHQAADYAELLMSIGPPTASVRQARAAKWEQIIAAATPLDPRPYYFGPDTTFVMSGCAWDHQVLVDGWHDAEPWGRWTDGATASLRLTVAEPATEPLRLELDIIPSPIGAALSITIEDLQFPAIDPVQGSNAWDIPLATTQRRRSVLLTLRVTGTVCPAQASGSADERILGIGVSAVRLRTRQPTLCQVGTRLPINAGSMPREVLLYGWHPLEDWGCWSNSRKASLRLTFAQPLAGTLTLEIDLAARLDETTLTVIVNETTLPPIVPCIGSNTWLLPETVTDGQSEIHVELHTSSTFCPAELNGSADDRILGVGIHSLGVYAFGTR